LRHNLPFLRALCDHKAFISGNITTKFIPDHYPDGFKGVEMTSMDWAKLACSAYTIHRAAVMARAQVDTSRGGKSPAKIESELGDLVVMIQNGPHLLLTKKPAMSAEMSPDDTFDEVEEEWSIEELMQHFNAISEDAIHIQVLGTPKSRAESKQDDAPPYRELSVDVGDTLPPMSARSQYAEGDRTCTSILASSSGGGGGGAGLGDGGAPGSSSAFVQIDRSETPNYQLVYKSEEFRIQAVPPRVYELMTHMPIVAPVDLSKMVLSPMPGLVYSVNIKEGQEVSLGQEVAVVEAMKMQNALQSPASGVIKKVLVEAGQSVDADQILIELE